MDYATQHKKNQQKDKRRSIIITTLMTLLLFLWIYFYQFTKIIPKENTITTLLINFGDNKNGQQSEEPLISETPAPTPEVTPIEKIEPTPPKTKPSEAPKEKVVTGKNEKLLAEKVEKTSKKEKNTETQKPVEKKKETPKKEVSKPSKNKTEPTPNAEKTNKNSASSAAIGNLIKGRGNKKSTQGDSEGSGNSGDPLGGNSNGNSKIGVDRKLIQFIPGTMGRGGSQPTHSCDASGTITISFTVDNAGNVISARRLSGTSDACIVNTTIGWIKKYVKAEKSNTSSMGTYTITF